MTYSNWDKISQIVVETSRTDVYSAVELAKRLMGMDITPLLRILGDYEGEPRYNTSIKGMLNHILSMLYAIEDRLRTVEFEMPSVNTNLRELVKYSDTVQPYPNKRAMRASYPYHVISYVATSVYQTASGSFWYADNWRRAGGSINAHQVGGSDGLMIRIPTPQIWWYDSNVVIPYHFLLQIMRNGNAPTDDAPIPVIGLYPDENSTVPFNSGQFDFDYSTYSFKTVLNPRYQDNEYIWARIFFSTNPLRTGYADEIALDVFLPGQPDSF